MIQSFSSFSQTNPSFNCSECSCCPRRRAKFLKHLLDEAFGALDPITRTEIHREFLRLQRSDSRTIVLVTHDLREALKLAEYIFILNDGSLEQQGKSGVILNEPHNEFVERFVHDQLDDAPRIHR